MAQTISVLASVATMVLGAVLAFRLLRLAARTRKAPELAMGLYCLLVTACGLLLWLAFRLLPPESGWVMPLSAASTFCVGAGAFALAVGVWRIFHPGAAWARATVAALGVFLAGSWVATLWPGEPVHLVDASPANLAFVAGRVAVYFFGAFEAFRYARMLWRRASLGMADPVSGHQILLWGVAWLSMSAIAIASVGIQVVLERSIYDSAVSMLLGSALNVTAWVCTWLAFFPPRAYQRWIERRAAQATA
ncbi:MAG: hypothetical protein R3263_05550 [Myxococcota bacterium]|nr:hypothetical protein [Myxococcota bacterium]